MCVNKLGRDVPDRKWWPLDVLCGGAVTRGSGRQITTRLGGDLVPGQCSLSLALALSLALTRALSPLVSHNYAELTVMATLQSLGMPSLPPNHHHVICALPWQQPHRHTHTHTHTRAPIDLSLCIALCWSDTTPAPPLCGGGGVV